MRRSWRRFWHACEPDRHSDQRENTRFREQSTGAFQRQGVAMAGCVQSGRNFASSVGQAVIAGRTQEAVSVIFRPLPNYYTQ